MNELTKYLAVFAVSASAPLAGALAQDDPSASCEVTDVNGAVTLVLCPAGLAPEQLAAAGQAACADRPLCGAWMWDDASKMPNEAPARHDELTQEQITAANAVWIAEQEQLVTIKNGRYYT